MSDFIPSAQLDFNEPWQQVTNLDFDNISDSDDVGVSISADFTVTASGLMTAENPVTGIAINAFYELNATASGTASYDSNVDRSARHEVSSDLQNSKFISSDKKVGFENNEFLSSNNKADWQQSKLVSINSQSVFEQNNKVSNSSTLLFEQSKLICTDNRQLYESQLFVSHNKQVSNEGAKRVSIGSWFGFEAMNKRQTERKIVYEGADWISKYSSHKSDIAQVIALGFDEKIEFTKVIYSAYSERFIVVVVDPDRQDPDRPPEPDFTASTILDFRCKWINVDTTLNFGIDCNQAQPSKGVIFVTNSVSLVRSDDGREIKLLGFTVGIDVSSYAWSFSATVPLSELSKVDIANEVQIGVEFTCNGNLWRFILDGCDDSIQFNESSLTIKGKSRAMLLADPYASTRSYIYDTALSSRQIADDELNRSGVPSGFTLDWQLAGVNGWNVPANSYSYTDKTPINSLQAIAEAAGGFINAHMSSDIIHVMPTYLIPSWEWAAAEPLITLPQSLITSRSRGRVNKPAYNGVFMYCSNDNGISALIKRTGTAGGYQPSMITSDLMTDQDAAISRGKAVLSDTGDIGNIAISMPLVSDVGVLKPSTIIGVDDGEQWNGMVKGTTITGSLSSNRALVIEQNIDVERHFDKETV